MNECGSGRLLECCYGEIADLEDGSIRAGEGKSERGFRRRRRCGG